jgi:hypothetical protein
MKKFISLLFVIFICGCSSVKTSDGGKALQDRQVATDFTDEGIKVTYTFTGKLEKIEVYGQADAWKGNVEALAEADALAKLVKFVHGTNVSTERRTKIMGLAIEKAQDSSSNKASDASGVMDFTDKELEKESVNKAAPSSESSAEKSASIVNKTMVTTITVITSKGRLTGLRKVKDFTQNNGKLYVAVYQWSDKDQATSQYLRDQMSR